MDFDSIKTFILVAKLKSFCQASCELPCAQSTVSRRINQGTFFREIFSEEGNYTATHK